MNSINLSKAFQNYKGLWVALTDKDTVISSNKSARKAHEEALKKGYKEPILFKVPLHDLSV